MFGMMRRLDAASVNDVGHALRSLFPLRQINFAVNELDRLTQSSPKVLLTDLQLPDRHGVDLIRETRQRFPDTEIMVISILGDEESVISAITVGATGYLLKDAFPTDIAATVHELVAGHSPISASIACFIVRRSSAPPARCSG